MPKIVFGDYYVHRDYIYTLPQELQRLVVEAIPLIPNGRGWNLVRINQTNHDLTFSQYPDFEENPHPELKSWTKINLKSRSVKSGSYTASNPFILHHKETFIDETHPLYKKFLSLSVQEEGAGLYLSPHSHLIGRKKYWEELLFQKDLAIDGNQLVKGASRKSLPMETQMRLFGETTVISPNEAIKMSGKTAMHRGKPSLPAKILVEKKIVKGNLFDWGCGRGTDLKFFQQSGIDAQGWDPNHLQQNPPSNFPSGSYGWVYSGYVLNTLPDPTERSRVLQGIFDFLPVGGHLAIAVRSLEEIQNVRRQTWKIYGDGWITPKGTFQKGFTSGEMTKLLVDHHFVNVQIILDSDAIFLHAEKQ